METTRTFHAREICYVGALAALMAVCSWLSVPTTPPFTLQTLGVFLTLGLLGGKLGTAAIAVYVLLGAFGLPVFAGFSGGIGTLLSSSGGYLIGFVLAGLSTWALERLLGRRPWVLVLSLLTAMGIYFAVGTLWFMAVYTRSTGPVGLAAAAGWCVVPFLLPDLLKMALALVITARVRPYVR